MLFNDTYQTIHQNFEGLYKDKGSKFLAYAYPLADFKDIKSIIQNLKSLHPKANHHCWAARIGVDRTVFKLSDDGEPSGTAGRPILNALLSTGVTNILVVVVRYFGGTLLGVTGLIQAYKSATAEALSHATLETETIRDVYELQFSSDSMNVIMRIIKENELLVKSQTYLDKHILNVAIRKSTVNFVITSIEKLHNVELKYLYSK